MKLRLAAVILSIVLLLPLGGVAQQAYPQRIISLGPAITEELFLLGAGDRLIACTIYCQRPGEAKGKEKIGTVTEASVEKIIALRPDLVLATSLTNPKVKEKLKNLGIRIVEFSAPENFSEICSSFLELGRLIGRQEQAQDIIKIVRGQVTRLALKVRGLPKPKIFIQLGTKPLVTVTKDSFVNDFVEFAGGINIAQGIRYVRYSREKVLEANPDVILIATMGINADKEREIWHSYEALNAARHDRIYIIDSYLLCSPTPISFVETLELITNLVHPQNG